MRAIPLAVALACIAPSPVARADVTVIYAPAAPAAPLVARTVSPVSPTAGSAVCAPASPMPSPPEPAARRGPASVALAPAPAASPSTADVPPAPGSPPGPRPSCAAPSPVLFVRRNDPDERASLVLTDCEGRPDPASLLELSLLARPRAVTSRPGAREIEAHAADPDWVARGVRRLHPGLLERLRALADRFPGHAIEIVSGYRPDAREGSRHLFGLALDVRVRGANLLDVHAFVRGFERTGVGLYPSSGFVHLDVRERSAHWIDESGPGEPPRIVRESNRAPVGESDSSAPASAAAALDPDAIADEVLAGLGRIALPNP